MFDRIKIFCAAFFLVMFTIPYAGSGAIAQDSLWYVSKSSGDFWVTTAGVQQVSLTEGETLKPGASIRTGRNGRVLLVRGEETILVSPNSTIGIPAEVKEGLSTTILQQAGSILLEVKKRDDKHFEVVTPYLAAVVKGTQFRVTVNKSHTSVGVLRGQVEVADFKSGQYALVLPGQAAKVSAHGTGGLSLSGSGVLSPIQQGKPRTSPVNPVPIPKEGYSARALSPIQEGKPRTSPVNPVPIPKGEESARLRTPNIQQVRITAPLGEVKLDFQKVTKGLSHAPIVSASLGHKSERTPDKRVGNADDKANSNVNTAGNGNGLGAGNGLGLASGFGNSNGLSGNGHGHGHGHWHKPKHGHGHGHDKGKGKKGKD